MSSERNAGSRKEIAASIPEEAAVEKDVKDDTTPKVLKVHHVTENDSNAIRIKPSHKPKSTISDQEQAALRLQSMWKEHRRKSRPVRKKPPLKDDVIQSAPSIVKESGIAHDDHQDQEDVRNGPPETKFEEDTDETFENSHATVATSLHTGIRVFKVNKVEMAAQAIYYVYE